MSKQKHKSTHPPKKSATYNQPNSLAVNRKPRILWANLYCLIDTSSGASMSIREILLQLVKSGFEIGIVGATIFDDPKGTTLLKDHWQEIKNHEKDTITINDGPLKHFLVTTDSTERSDMTAKEENKWFSLYQKALSDIKPDIVFYYGGQALDFLISHEARLRNIPSVAYLVNGNYMSRRWCRDVDLIITDSQATSKFYQENQGFTPKPVGKFINPEKVIAKNRDPKYLTFINPSLAKGAGVVVQLALMLEAKRPDIKFEVIESRGNWHQLVKLITEKQGNPRDSLHNVIVTPNTDDMRTVYQRSRVLLAPSLWWESGARVLAEAMLNGIPAVVTQNGGSPEMIQDGGIVIKMPAKCHEKPFTEIPQTKTLQPVADTLERFFDDEDFYQSYVEKAKAVGESRHRIEVSTERLIKALQPLLQQKAGDLDHEALAESHHKHPNTRLDDPQKKPSTTEKEAQTPTLSIPSPLIEKLKGTTMVTADRLESLYRSVHSVLNKNISGDFVECGVFKGGCCMLMAEVLVKHNINDRDLWLYDTFEGMTQPSDKDKRVGIDSENANKKAWDRFKKDQKSTHNEWCYGPIQTVKNNLAQTDLNQERLHFIKGRVEDTLPESGMPDKIAILRLDTDWYESTLHELVHLFPNLSDGGVLIVDDYFYWDGCKKAVDEYFETNPTDLFKVRVGISLVAIKEPKKVDWDPKPSEIAPFNEVENPNQTPKTKQTKLSPDQAIKKLLPEKTLQTPGSIRWLIDKEKQFGGLIQNVARNKISPKDVRTPESIRSGGMQGGDRMSFNLHGYALAYATYLKPMLVKTEKEHLTLVEVGILKGTGLAIWCDLFPSATVLGLDIDIDNCLKNIPSLKQQGAFTQNQPVLHEFDAYEGKSAQIEKILQGKKIDIFIDDGPHTRDAILNTFRAIKPFLANTFVAFIEDNSNIAKELRELLPEFCVLNQGELTVIFPENLTFASRIPTLQQLISEVLIMQKRLGYQPNLEAPQTFNEKIVRRKLFGAPKNAHILADKLAVRDYVKERVGEEILTDIYQVVESSKEIDWEALPQQFVMKSNHANAQVEIVRDKNQLDKAKAEALCDQWLSSTYGQQSNEYWYAEIPPKVFF